VTIVYTSILDENKAPIGKAKRPHECFFYVPSEFKEAGGKAVYVQYFPTFNTKAKTTKEFFSFAETFPFFQEKEETAEEFLETKIVTINARKIHSRKLLSILFLARYPHEFPEIVEDWARRIEKEKNPFKAFVEAHNYEVGTMWNSNHTFFNCRPKSDPDDLAKVFDPRAKKYMEGLKDKFLSGGTFYQRGEGFTEFCENLENYK